MNTRQRFLIFVVAAVLVMATACSSATPTPATKTNTPVGPTSTNTPIPGGTNKLLNPGFESGNTVWSGISGNWSIVQPGGGNTYAGTWALKATVTTPSGGGPYQSVSGIPNELL